MKARLITREVEDLRRWVGASERRQAALLTVGAELERELEARERRWLANELRARGWGKPALRDASEQQASNGEHPAPGVLTERKDER